MISGGGQSPILPLTISSSQKALVLMSRSRKVMPEEMYSPRLAVASPSYRRWCRLALKHVKGSLNHSNFLTKAVEGAPFAADRSYAMGVLEVKQ